MSRTLDDMGFVSRDRLLSQSPASPPSGSTPSPAAPVAPYFGPDPEVQRVLTQNYSRPAEPLPALPPPPPVVAPLPATPPAAMSVLDDKRARMRGLIEAGVWRTNETGYGYGGITTADLEAERARMFATPTSRVDRVEAMMAKDGAVATLYPPVDAVSVTREKVSLSAPKGSLPLVREVTEIAALANESTEATRDTFNAGQDLGTKAGRALGGSGGSDKGNWTFHQSKLEDLQGNPHDSQLEQAGANLAIAATFVSGFLTGLTGEAAVGAKEAFFGPAEEGSRDLIDRWKDRASDRKNERARAEERAEIREAKTGRPQDVLGNLAVAPRRITQELAGTAAATQQEAEAGAKTKADKELEHATSTALPLLGAVGAPSFGTDPEVQRVLTQNYSRPAPTMGTDRPTLPGVPTVALPGVVPIMPALPQAPAAAAPSLPSRPAMPSVPSFTVAGATMLPLGSPSAGPLGGLTTQAQNTTTASKLATFVKENALPLGVAATTLGAGAAGVGVAVAAKRRSSKKSSSKRSSSKKSSSKRSSSKKSSSKKSSSKRKTKGKPEDRSGVTRSTYRGQKVYKAKNGARYVLMKNGKARFIPQ